MAGLDNNTIFYLRGDEFKDLSSNEIAVASSLSSSQIVSENNSGVDIKCIDFNSNGYIRFDLNSSFLNEAFTIDWWEKDAPNKENTTSCLFGNATGATGTMSFALPTWENYRMTIAMSSDNANWDIASSIVVGDNIFGEWVHRAVVYDKQCYKIYQNGILRHTVANSTPCFSPLNEFQMGRWRTNSGALNKKVYNFRISDTVRWEKNFTPQVRYYDELEETTEELTEEASYNDVVDCLVKVTSSLAVNLESISELQNKINVYNYTNTDGMLEQYNWVNLNGLKIMWINVKLSEDEYNSGTSGSMMKTLNFPTQAQIFDNIIMTNIASYNRSANNTLSRVIQNSEIISNTSVRGRWKHFDNTRPYIDKFTILCIGF